jgi:tripartite-type tricarboxylate transporter receptor subunit TctC
MSVELLKHLAGMDLLHVPYKGAGPAAIDLIAGNVQLMIGTLSLTLPHVNSGRLRALGITSVKRHPALPALPAVGETVAGYRFEVWYALFAPAGTPPAVVQRLNAAVAQTMDTATTREKLAAEGLEIVTGSPDEASAHLRRELDVWARVVKAIGQYAD